MCRPKFRQYNARISARTEGPAALDAQPGEAALGALNRDEFSREMHFSLRQSTRRRTKLGPQKRQFAVPNQPVMRVGGAPVA